MVRLPCACANLRRTARLVTQLYEQALRPAGITGPQFTLLQALSVARGARQKQLAEILGIDSTTLTRNLALLEKRGWLRAEQATDRRAMRLGLTAAGERKYQQALPYWQSAQKQLKRALGATKWHQLLDALVDSAQSVSLNAS
jgi:DNA-binding MarR family transcriptional regulator